MDILYHNSLEWGVNFNINVVYFLSLRERCPQDREGKNMSKTKGNILIIDDNEEALIALEMYLIKHFTSIRTEKNPNLIPNLISNQDFDVIILDMNFSAGISSGNEGLFWLNEINKIDPTVAVVFITAYGDIELAVKGIKLGAVDFITKPWENEKLLATVEAAFRLRQSGLEIKNLKSKQQHLAGNIESQFSMFKGTSLSMQKIFIIIDKVSATDANILILGENGTGKELIAREIHKRSNRAHEVFITIDMAALPESLFESELFGYSKGAFTDAHEDKPGRFEIAKGGTLFLDEIGNLPIQMQSKILTALQNREIFKVGSNKAIPINFRLIAATNKSLYNMVDDNEFREDLLYRINTIQIELPPLRDRIEDIEGLVYFFLEKYGSKYNKKDMKVHGSAFDKLKKYPWPGNIRELDNVTEKTVIMADSKLLNADNFQFHTPLKTSTSKRKIFSLEENEKIIIREAMQDCNGNLSDTADRLGITRATLYRKIKKYDL